MCFCFDLQTAYSDSKRPIILTFLKTKCIWVYRSAAVYQNPLVKILDYFYNCEHYCLNLELQNGSSLDQLLLPNLPAWVVNPNFIYIFVVVVVFVFSYLWNNLNWIELLMETLWGGLGKKEHYFMIFSVATWKPYPWQRDSCIEV